MQGKPMEKEEYSRESQKEKGKGELSNFSNRNSNYLRTVTQLYILLKKKKKGQGLGNTEKSLLLIIAILYYMLYRFRKYAFCISKPNMFKSASDFYKTDI